ncbi:hypothetical protein ACNQR7_32190 [Mycolicibacterium senegalense]|uniref:hypothetical protein n=1 Tax=Mycolicibacterium senegalense TaxID=1796 RepID=UPI003AAE076D
MTITEDLEREQNAAEGSPTAPLDTQPAQQFLHQERVSPQWTLTVLAAEGGTIPSVEMEATHRNGRSESFSVSLWPTGWRILRHGLTIPNAVRKAAIRIAANGTDLGPPRAQTTNGSEPRPELSVHPRKMTA